MRNWFDTFFQTAGGREVKPLLRPLRLGIYALYVLTILVVASVIVWFAWRDHQRAVADIENQTFSLARLLDEHATRTLISVEQAMQNIGEDIERAGGIAKLDERTTHVRLKEKVQLTPQIRAIIAMDSSGILRAHGLEYPTRHIDLGDRDYFAYHRTDPDTRFRIGEPIVSRTDYKWLIPLTRRLNLSNGTFDGVTLAGVEPNYFLRFYESLKLLPGTRLQILRSDGIVLLTFPLDTATIGRNLRETDPQAFSLLPLSRTAFLDVRDKAREFYLTQLTNQSNLPLIIRISTDRKKALEKYRQETFTKVASALVLMLVVSVMLYLLIRQIRRVEESESRLYLTQFTVDESPDMILWCDHNGQVRYANRCMADISGYGVRDLLGLKYPDLLIQDEETWENLRLQMIALHLHNARNTLLTELPVQHRQVLETQLRSRDGHLTPVEITLSLIEFNEETYLCISARDITARQEAERELRQHRDHLQELVAERTAEIRTVLDASPLAIVLSIHGHIRLVNPAFETLFGYQSGDAIGKPDSTIYESLDSYRIATESISHRTMTGGTYRGEMELRRRDGSTFWAMLFAKTIAQEAPERGMILVVEDITAQRIAAQAVRQSEQLKRTILDTTADGFALIDCKRRIVDVNDSFCRTLGLKRENLIGKHPENIWGESSKNLFPQHQGELVENASEEITLPARDGLLHPFLSNNGIIRDEKGETEYTYVFLTDISNQKEIERTLLESKNAAEAANNAKSVFLANMSHELRTPMHAILSFSEMGIHKTPNTDPEQVIRYFERIHSSGKRLLTLLNDLLDMSRLEANKMTYDKSRHILQSTVRNAVNEISSLLAGKQLSLEIDEHTPKILAIYDKARITQVLVNLLSNAIKFSPQGAHLHIQYLDSACLENGQAAVGLVVRDEGPGIPESELESIFEIFSQGKMPSAGGTGLGLSISRQIIRDHHGSITARNHPAGGAAFTVLLPLEAETSHPETSDTGSA